MRQVPSTSSQGDPQGHGGTQSPDADGTAGNFMRLDRHGKEGRFRDGGGKADGKSKGIHPVVVGPVNVFRVGYTQEPGVSQLCGHGLAQREQRQFQTFQKESQPDEHIGKAQ